MMKSIRKQKNTQVDQNGVVYDPKTDRKLCKNGVFTAVFRVFMVRFRSVSHPIISFYDLLEIDLNKKTKLYLFK